MASSSNLITPKPKKQSQVNQEARNWLELPSDVTANILLKIGVVDILENAQKVCTDWWKICKNPAMWRVIHMQYNYNVRVAGAIFPNVSPQSYKEMCKLAVDRSQGQLVDITILGFGDNELLQYVADRSEQLIRLEIGTRKGITSQNWTEALKKFPLLEELSVCSMEFPKDAIETAGRCCPKLKKLRLNQVKLLFFFGFPVCDKEIIAVLENFRELRHLELIGSMVTQHGLKAILDGCRHLESLDLHRCMNVKLNRNLWKQLRRIKCLKLPNESLEGCSRFFSDDYDDDDDALL